MNNKEEKLSNYIDSLNDEKKPSQHGSETESDDMEELFQTVRLVRSLKEASIPKGNYTENLAANINKQILSELKPASMDILGKINNNVAEVQSPIQNEAGNSPWKLDPAYVSQVFVSLKISPEGIQGDYPVKYDEIKLALLLHYKLNS